MWNFNYLFRELRILIIYVSIYTRIVKTCTKPLLFFFLNSLILFFHRTITRAKKKGRGG